MKLLGRIGALLIACSAICFIIAIERYLTAVRTAEKIASLLEEIEFESVSIPIESTVCGLAGVVMLVAGISLLLEARKSKPDKGLLKTE